MESTAPVPHPCERNVRKLRGVFAISLAYVDDYLLEPSRLPL